MQLENLKQEILHPKHKTQHKARNATNGFLLVFNSEEARHAQKNGPPEYIYFIITTPFNCLGIRGPVAGRAALAAVLNGCFQFVFSELTAFGLPQRDDYAWLRHVPSQPSRAALAAVLNGCFQFVFSELTLGMPQRNECMMSSFRPSQAECCVELMLEVSRSSRTRAVLAVPGPRE